MSLGGLPLILSIKPVKSMKQYPHVFDNFDLITPSSRQSRSSIALLESGKTSLKTLC